MVEYRTQNKFGEEEAYSNFYFHIIVHQLREVGVETQGRTWSQELMQRPWKSAANCLATHGLLYFVELWSSIHHLFINFC